MNKNKKLFIVLSVIAILILSVISITAENKNEVSEGKMENKNITIEKATFGGGCFWGVEAGFRQIEGVKATSVGYLGGTLDNPTYEDVCSKNSGHAEVVEIDFDPSVVSYEKLLDTFWELHDPTTLNRQGPDIGSQYRSAVFYHNDKQKEIAELSKSNEQNSGNYKSDIVTEITAASIFYVAEDYHQQYLEKRGLSSCKIK